MDQRIVSKLRFILIMIVCLLASWLTEENFCCCSLCRTSMYDSRARERRRQIEEQEALAAQLLRQVSIY